MAKAAELFRQAEAAAENDAVRARVRKARLGIDYVRLTRAKRFTVHGGWYRPADLDGLKNRWNAFVAGLGQFGITNLSESSPLTRDERDFAEFMRPYRVVTIENDRLRVHIAPELEGRVIQIFDKSQGKDLLYQPDPSTKQYPNIGGVIVAPYSDYVARVPWAVKWELEAGRTATAVSLVGVCENGLRMRRRLRLKGAFLRTQTTLENAGKEPVEALLQSRWEVDPEPIAVVSVAYRTQSERVGAGGMVRGDFRPRFSARLAVCRVAHQRQIIENRRFSPPNRCLGDTPGPPRIAVFRAVPEYSQDFSQILHADCANHRALSELPGF